MSDQVRNIVTSLDKKNKRNVFSGVINHGSRKA